VKAAEFTMQRVVLPTTWPTPVVLLIGLAVRLALVNFNGFGYDIQGFQEWTRQMLAEPLSSFYAADLTVPPDHLPGDLWVLYALGHIWQWLGGGVFAGYGAAMIAIKVVGILLDLALAMIVAALVRNEAGDRAARIVLLAMVFNPALIFVSAIWGQWNALAITLVVAAIATIVRWGDAGLVAGLPVLAAATLVKPQFLILLAPIVVFVHRRHQRGTSWLPVMLGAVSGGVASVALVMLAITPFNVGLPGLRMGTRWSIVERVEFAADRFHRTSMGAYNLWKWMMPGGEVDDRLTLAFGLSYRQVGFAMFAVLLVYALVVAWRWPDARIGMILAMAIITLAVFMVLTSSHSRYVVPGMVFILIAAALAPSLRLTASVVMLGALLNIWAGFGLHRPEWVGGITYPAWLPWLLASVNMVGFGLLLWHAWPRPRYAASTDAMTTSSAITWRETTT